jgi:hypothetical protein
MKLRWGTMVAIAMIATTHHAMGDERSDEARTAFLEGTKLVANAEWSEALLAFEHAAAITPHAITTYNMGACERAMGNYTRAQARFLEALAQHRASGDKELPPNVVNETRTFLKELDAILVRATVTFEPAGATLTVDGRPLEPVDRDADPPVFAAGLRAAGVGEIAPTRFALLLNPGQHVFVFSRKGFANAVVNRTVRAGESPTLNLALERLPATLRIESNRAAAIVKLNDIDVGPVPAELLRPAGDYRIVVSEPGFVPYETHVALLAGEETKLEAPLKAEKPSVLTRPWFWTVAAVVVAGATTATYFATRPSPQRAPVGTGTLGWGVSLK